MFTITDKINTDFLVKVNSLQEAKEKIYSDIQNGKNYRDIVKTKFDINDTIKTFNIQQISQIKEEFEPKIEESSLDNDKARVFKLFKKGYSPTDVIIKTKLNFEYVKEAWDQYAEINSKEIIPTVFFDRLKSIIERGGWGGTSLKTILNAVNEAVILANELDQYNFSCCECGGKIPIDGKTLEDVKKTLSKVCGHTKCMN